MLFRTDLFYCNGRLSRNRDISGGLHFVCCSNTNTDVKLALWLCKYQFKMMCVSSTNIWFNIFDNNGHVSYDKNNSASTGFELILIDTNPPSAAYMRRWTGSALIQIMACRLGGAKPLSKPMLTYCQLKPKEHISVKFYLKFGCFYSRNCVWTCRLRNGGHFVQGKMS